MISNIDTPTAAQEVGLKEIELAARTYSGALGELRDEAATLNAAIEALKAERLPRIKKIAQRMATREVELHGMVEQSPQLFIKPRTYVFCGIEVGWEKQRGKIVFTKAKVLVDKIRKLFPDRVKELIRDNPKPDKKALGKLPVADLKRLGCTVTDSGDAVVIRSVATDADKLIEALLGAAVEKQAVEEEQD